MGRLLTLVRYMGLMPDLLTVLILSLLLRLGLPHNLSMNRLRNCRRPMDSLGGHILGLLRGVALCGLLLLLLQIPDRMSNHLRFETDGSSGRPGSRLFT